MNAALVIAHPGHELRVFGWASTTRPLTMVLTRGDGPAGDSRIASTSRVLASVGAAQGPIYGRFSDREIYELLLTRDVATVTALRDELAAAFVDAGIDVVACDAEEFYNPSHDLCRYLTASAAQVASRRTGRLIRLYDFPLIGSPDTCPDALRPRAIRLELGDATWQRKLEHARCYPELQIEVDRALAVNGAEAFRGECLRPAAAILPTPSSIPFYELYGERQVQAGHYTAVIRYDPHVMALRDAIDQGRPEA